MKYQIDDYEGNPIFADTMEETMKQLKESRMRLLEEEKKRMGSDIYEPEKGIFSFEEARDD